MATVYRALIRETGEILEHDDFKSVYRFALRLAKDELRYPGRGPVILVEFETATYSSYYRLNKYGYPQQDLLSREHIAYLAVSESGYTIDYQDSTLDVDRECWKSKQIREEVC